MNILKWFKRNSGVKVKKIKKPYIEMGEMASANPSHSADRLISALSKSKILMVQDESYDHKVSEYVIKLAQKLDCDVISLDISNTVSGYKNDRETKKFVDIAGFEFNKFDSLAKQKDINTCHFVSVGDIDKKVSDLCCKDLSIRYIVSKPEQCKGKSIPIPVVDVRCSRLYKTM